MRKAYEVETPYPEYGSKIVYAETASKAKSLVAGCFDVPYINLYVRREKNADKYLSIAVNDELDWAREEHRRILEKEFGFREL